MLKNDVYCVTNVRVSKHVFQSLSEEDTNFAHSCTLPAMNSRKKILFCGRARQTAFRLLASPILNFSLGPLIRHGRREAFSRAHMFPVGLLLYLTLCLSLGRR